MITFNPGPSQISAATQADITNAFEQNVPSISHRTTQFTAVSQKADEQLRQYFGIPDTYTIIWGSSATEMMELIINSAVATTSAHFTNGNFSDRFAEVARLAGRTIHKYTAEWGTSPDFLVDIPSEVELITLTQNETSTGFQVPMTTITAVRQKNPDPLLIIDATSIMGVEYVDITAADSWLFSIQKCFGLPAGLGVLIINDRCIERIKKISRQYDHVLSLSARIQKMQKNYQTVQTPNSLGIFLLGAQAERWNQQGGLQKIWAQTDEKFQLFKQFIDTSDQYDFFIEEPLFCSKSVFCIRTSEKHLELIQKRATAKNMVLGGGYGKLKKNCFRIANFPNLTVGDFEKLIEQVLS
jgi:phosphoserine aminotransferase